MKVAVLEYLSGGGLIDQAVSPSLRQEGMAMLCALANDLSLCGHQVCTCLDSQAVAVSHSLHADVEILELGPSPQDWLNRWKAIACACDRSIVIAPELDYQLEQIVERLRKNGAIVVASSKDFIGATSDKWMTADLLSMSAVPHPYTCTLSQFVADSASTTSHTPMTLKRRDGAGCADMNCFVDQSALRAWLSESSSQVLDGEEWIVQPWLAGRPVSMAVIAGDQWQVLGAVEQFIDLAPSSSESGRSIVTYQGGLGPFREVPMQQLETLANKVRDALPPGAYGWIGIDFLVPIDAVGSKELVVIEINPRLTTSYLGYRQWYGHQLANALIIENEGSSIASLLSSTLRSVARTRW